MTHVATHRLSDRAQVESVPVVAGDTDYETAARYLEDSGRYRILRRLATRPIRRDRMPQKGENRRVAIILDTETTGLDPRTDEIVELGMLAVTYGAEGIQDVVGEFEASREPSVPLPPAVSQLTGIGAEALKGKAIDAGAVAQFVENADVIVAHNASFDRAFCERLFPALATIRWACSASDIPWRDDGVPDAKLATLLSRCGLFHDGHRALSDCHALLEVLSRRPSPDTEAPFCRLMTSLDIQKVAVVASGGDSYAYRDALKQRGYRWMPLADASGKKAWRIVLPESDARREVSWLHTTVFRRSGAPNVTSL